VHAPDLPGFGSSSKPATGAYNARWFADTMLGMMDELGIKRAHFVGNSMGGRVALEIGMIAPERVGGLGLLCPAVAFVHRGLHPIVRLLRPEVGMLPHGFRRSVVASQFWGIFHDRDAFLSSARNIYLERPFGRGGFYPRLADLRPPALFIWADHDPVIPAAFGKHVRTWLPGAPQVVIEDCGHVPQVERADETNALLLDFFARIEVDGHGAHGRAAPRRAQAA
jgi:pimeloyl-ACP methyl ester carboxylesterase